MASFTKGIVRVAVVGGLVVGAGVLIAGPERVHAIGQQIRATMVNTIDRHIEDPIAMRQQLRALESKYPKRIAEARAMLAELNQQIEQVSRDKAVSERVVALAQTDLDELKDLLARAEDAKAGFTGSGRHVVTVSFDNRKMDLTEAYTQANRIADTAASYAARVAECERELAHLQRDARQTESLLAKLTAEYADFQTQLANLDRQIDTVARKERMVQLMADRQRRIDELSRYKAESLDQFKSTLASRVAQLDARLESLAGREDRVSYEERARIEVDTESSARLRLEQAPRRLQSESPVTETIIDGESSDADAGPVAFR
ncbi:MAG: hypothetical protein D6693_06750 [Planctomycetota bacterium]|nr:MAG: hypothetical protein D6693_06750 [Planctomycetota bacterium]